jgi:hypothetical protein
MQGQSVPKPGWTVLPPEPEQQLTYSPAGLAVSLFMIFWGIIASLLITMAGGLLFVVAAVGWVRGMRHGGSRNQAS